MPRDENQMKRKNGKGLGNAGPLFLHLSYTSHGREHGFSPRSGTVKRNGIEISDSETASPASAQLWPDLMHLHLGPSVLILEQMEFVSHESDTPTVDSDPWWVHPSWMFTYLWRHHVLAYPKTNPILLAGHFLILCLFSISCSHRNLKQGYIELWISDAATRW